jgi:hypothetical protein
MRTHKKALIFKSMQATKHFQQVQVLVREDLGEEAVSALQARSQMWAGLGTITWHLRRANTVLQGRVPWQSIGPMHLAALPDALGTSLGQYWTQSPFWESQQSTLPQ